MSSSVDLRGKRWPVCPTPASCRTRSSRSAASPASSTPTPAGAPTGVEDLKPARHPKIDCFYVYPTVSDQKQAVATRAIDPQERSIALYQAARYSRVCRVFAPMYRQLTLQGIAQPRRSLVGAAAYADVAQAWRTYLKHDNRGRGIVLIGHSQGTFV